MLNVIHSEGPSLSGDFFPLGLGGKLCDLEWSWIEVGVTKNTERDGLPVCMPLFSCCWHSRFCQKGMHCYHLCWIYQRGKKDWWLQPYSMWVEITSHARKGVRTCHVQATTNCSIPTCYIVYHDACNGHHGHSSPCSKPHPTNVSESHYRNTQWVSDLGMMATFFYLPDIFSTFSRLFDFFRPLCSSLMPSDPPEVLFF